MIKGIFRFIRGIFRYAFRGLDLLRRLLLNLIFVVLIAALAVSLWWRPTPSLPDSAVLLLRPAGALVEQSTLGSPLELISPNPQLAAQTQLRDLLSAVRAAREDERIRALIIETDDLSAGGVARLSELRAEIQAFRDAGKPVLARAERFSEGQYYLASVADEVHLSPDGFLMLRGLARYANYFARALESLGVKVNVFRVGDYKSFAEPFMRSDMSAEDRENTLDLLNGVWNTLTADIAHSRELDPAEVRAWSQRLDQAWLASDGDLAQAALEAGLVDALTARDEWRALLRDRFDVQDKNGPLSVARYLAAHSAQQEEQGERIAVLVAQGAIMDGQGTPGSVGGDSFVQLLRETRADPSVRAIVVRIDSPGGSAWASELIRREMENTRIAGKPVIASMSSTAASGGYWIASGASEIYAHPLTLTGSIGIFALFPDLSEPMARLGINVDGVATGPFAGVPDPRRPLSPQAVTAMQAAIEHGYRRFLQTVADARGLDVAEVELLAQGRVWTGEAASKLGLVDELGGLHDAIAAAAQRVGLEQYQVVWPAARISPRDRLLRTLGEFVAGDTAPAATAGSPFGDFLVSIQREAQSLLSWNDPRHLYVHCLCEGP